MLCNTSGGHNISSLGREVSYILVHQAGLANAAVAEDNNLESSLSDIFHIVGLDGETWLWYLQKDLLSGSHDRRDCRCGLLSMTFWPSAQFTTACNRVRERQNRRTSKRFRWCRAISYWLNKGRSKDEVRIRRSVCYRCTGGTGSDKSSQWRGSGTGCRKTKSNKSPVLPVRRSVGLVGTSWLDSGLLESGDPL